MSVRSTTTPKQTIGEQDTGESQLRLLPGGSTKTRPEWQLDERTRQVGRVGVAQAREVLRQARPPQPKHPAPIRKAS